MISKTKEDLRIFVAFCADWECVIKASDAEEASCKALEEASRAYGKDMNLSPAIGIIDVSKIYSNMSCPDDIYFIYTPKALANAGLHDLASKYENVIKILKDNSNDN